MAGRHQPAAEGLAGQHRACDSGREHDRGSDSCPFPTHPQRTPPDSTVAQFGTAATEVHPGPRSILARADRTASTSPATCSSGWPASGRRTRRCARSGRTAPCAPTRSSRRRPRPPRPRRAWPALGVGRGDVVMTLMGARPEWVFALLGAWRLGAVALPCSEQLRAKDIALRIAQARPALVLAAERDMAELQERARGRRGPAPVARRRCRGPAPRRARRAQPADTAAADPALLIFTSGTAGEPRARRAHAGLPARPGDAGRALVRPARRRAGVVHRGQRLVEVGAQRVRGAVDEGRRRPAARCPLRARGAARDGRRARRRRAVPVADRVPHDRQAGLAPGGAASVPAAAGLRRRAAQPGGDRRSSARRWASTSTTATARRRPAS